MQALQYVAAALGLKPLLDDWIPKHRLPDFIKACRRYGLRVTADVQFQTVALSTISDRVVGKANLTSTTAYAVPLEADPIGSTHVYVSRHRSLLREGMWYPLIVRGRVIQPPYADTLRYGDQLPLEGAGTHARLPAAAVRAPPGRRARLKNPLAAHGDTLCAGRIMAFAMSGPRGGLSTQVRIGVRSSRWDISPHTTSVVRSSRQTLTSPARVTPARVPEPVAFRPAHC